MPLVSEQQQTKRDAEWFQPECMRDNVADEIEWNARHIALGTVAATADWTITTPAEHEWLTAEPLFPFCGVLQLYDLSEIDLPIFGENIRILEIRLQAERLQVEFDALSKKWQRDTRHLSLISQKITHPAYLRIIGMGEAAIPLLLNALRDRPAHWFAALRATANTDPANEEDAPSQARDAWIRWGILEDYID